MTYTPTTGYMRHVATEPHADVITGEEFDRWLAEHDRQVAEAAWDEGALAEANRWIRTPTNPHRTPQPTEGES